MYCVCIMFLFCSFLVYIDEYSEVLSALVWLSLVYKSLDTTIPCKCITSYHTVISFLCYLVDDWFSGKLFPALQQATPMLSKTDTSSLCHYDIEVGTCLL